MRIKLNDKETITERVRIGQILRTRRRILHINQTSLANKLGISTTAYAKIERGITAVSFDRLMKICSLLNIDMATLSSMQDNALQYDALASLYREIKSLKDETKKFRRYLAGENCTVFIKSDVNTKV